MNQRVQDILLVVFVLAVLKGLFELTRLLLRRFIALLAARGHALTRDTAIQWGIGFLLCGLLLLPFFTSILALFDNRTLAGGIALHLLLVAVSIVLFSFAEDLIRLYNTFPAGRTGLLPVGSHVRKMLPFIGAFWAVGFLLLSPIFYTALALLILVFFLAVLYGRKKA
jgi:hypothetical protein